MNIMVFDVPAESGGALTVLNDFYNEVKYYKDRDINWIFVVSKPELQQTDNIKVLRFSWIKKSWFHRLYFDNFIAPKLIKKYNVDKVFSLQNVVMPYTKVSQILYVHNSLPFIDYRFAFRENKKLWIYQNIIGKNIISSIKKADKVIVQTKWMKKACMDKANVEREKIDVVYPKISTNIDSSFEANATSLKTFFYPANGMYYKNHRLIVEACKELKKQNIDDYKVLFTLKGNENDHIKKLYRQVIENKLPIEFLGRISRQKVFELYAKSILIFPSYIETFGLPMLEAKLHRGIILASDCPFSHEILDGYKNAYFFDPFNYINLSKKMFNVLQKRTYCDVSGNIDYNIFSNDSVIQKLI